jgi:hypothetical protein
LLGDNPRANPRLKSRVRWERCSVLRGLRAKRNLRSPASS